MKKIIFIITIFLIVKNVNAETIYGEYYKVASLNNEPMDEIKIDTYKIYNTYDFAYKDLGYLEENNEYIKDENDYIEKEIVATNIENADEYITVRTSLLDRNYIILKNISKNLKIYEIEVYYNDEKIEYSISNNNQFSQTNSNNINNIKDEDFNTYYIYTQPRIDLMIGFKEMYKLKDLKVIIHIEENSLSSFILYLENKTFIKLNNNKKHTITFSNEEIQDVTYSYKETIKLYKYYEKYLLKKDIYVKDGENLLLEDYKIINDYYKRDKLILKDNLIINSKDTNVNSFISYSSNEVIINNNIDNTKNGTYKCIFILNDIKIEKDVIVELEKNNLTSNINNQNSIKLNKEKDLNKKTYISKKTKTKSQKLKTTTTTQKINKKVTTTNIVNKIYKKTKRRKSKILKIIILILFMVIEIILLLKKKKR